MTERYTLGCYVKDTTRLYKGIYAVAVATIVGKEDEDNFLRHTFTYKDINEHQTILLVNHHKFHIYKSQQDLINLYYNILIKKDLFEIHDTLNGNNHSFSSILHSTGTKAVNKLAFLVTPIEELCKNVYCWLGAEREFVTEEDEKIYEEERKVQIKAYQELKKLVSDD